MKRKKITRRDKQEKFGTVRKWVESKDEKRRRKEARERKEAAQKMDREFNPENHERLPG